MDYDTARYLAECIGENIVMNQPDQPTIRDQFAAQLPSDEIRELTYQSLSRRAKESVTGAKAPLKEDFKEDIVAFQIAELEFNCLVNAAVRFKLADAMIKAREAE